MLTLRYSSQGSTNSCNGLTAWRATPTKEQQYAHRNSSSKSTQVVEQLRGKLVLILILQKKTQNMYKQTTQEAIVQPIWIVQNEPLAIGRLVYMVQMWWDGESAKTFGPRWLGYPGTWKLWDGLYKWSGYGGKELKQIEHGQVWKSPLIHMPEECLQSRW